jgi:DNA-binding response OmpR family regulator
VLREWRNLIKIFFDCTLLDYQLPDSNGIHLLQEILYFGGTSSPINFVTGKGGETIAAKALKAEALDYISKENVTRAFISMYPQRDKGSWSRVES